MKIVTRILKLFVALACVMFSTGAFGQGATRIWTGGGDGVDIDSTNNWGGTVPTSSAGDIGEWNGTPAGNLLLTHNSSGPLNSGTPGVSFYLTASQTGSVNISSRVAASANIALNGITIDNGGGAFSLGDGTANVLNIILRPSSGGAPFPIHLWANNSANVATIFPNVRYQSGGGNPHTIQIDGTGDWVINNALNNANAGNNNNFIVKTGSGSLFWNPSSITGAAGVNGIGSPIDIEGGRVVLTASATELGTQRITNNATLQFDAAGSSQTFSGPINGTGTVRVSNGTLTLSSAQSDFTGTVDITNKGVLVLGGTQNVGGTGPLGVGSTILFNGGTLQFSAANSFDYSPQFSTAANQAYKFDTAAQNVTFTNALTSAGGTFTKLGSGVLTLTGANTYGGLTIVGAGKLLIQGSAGTGGIVVSNSTVLGVTATGTAIAPATLTVGTSGGATLEFNNITSTSLAPLAAGTISAGGPITVNVASGSFVVGQSYPLFSWTSGPAPAVTLGTLVGAVGNLSTNGTRIQLNVTGLAYVWSGLTDGNWDATTPNNWKVNGASQIWSDGNAALFDDNTSGITNITVNSPVAPAITTVNSSSNAYTIVSSGPSNIGGGGGLTKNGNSVLVLTGGANTYSGATTISGGTLSVSVLANGGSPSDIGQAGSGAANLVLNGGTLQYTGGPQDSDRLFTLGTGNGTIDSSGFGALNLTNTGAVILSGTGARTLTLKGSDVDDNTLAAFIGDNGGATALAKSGPGKWILTGNNTNSGTVTIAAGTLQIGNGGTSASIGTGNVVDNGTLSFNTTGTVTNGAITGTGSVSVDGGGTVVLPGNNTYSGATTVNDGTLQIGNGGASGSLNSGSAIVNNGTIVYNSTSTVNLGGSFGAGITGSGNVIVRKGTLQAIGNNSYSGWTQIDPGATFEPSVGNVGLLASSVVTNNGTLLFSRQDNAVFIYNGDIVGAGAVKKIANNGNNGDVTLNGHNTYTGGTYILGGTIIFGDGGTPGAGSFLGDVYLTNDYADNAFGLPPNDFVPAVLIFNRPDDFTFPGNIVGEGFVTQSGSGILTLTGNNTYTNRGTGATTTINAGTLQVGNGGATGSIGSGPVVNNGTLVFNLSSTQVISGAVTGNGVALVKKGTGTVAILGTNTYFAPTTVSNGTLRVSTLHIGNGDFTVEDGATLAVTNTGGAASALIGNLNLGNGGATTLEFLNVADPATRVVSLSGALTVNGNTTIKITGASGLAAGKTYPLVGYAAFSGGTFSVSLPAGVTATVTNDTVNSWIALNVTAAPAAAPPAQFKGISLSGTNVIISATNNNGAGGTWTLVGTNNIAAPLSTWPVISTGSFDSAGSISITNPAAGTGRMFYNLRTP
jgi:fibronectin-binding autotransporter adhesin